MTNRLITPVGAQDHVAGTDAALVTLVEYGDYECGFCARAHTVVRALQRRLGERLRFVFRNFPLTEMHPQALGAAEAAEAAGAQGHFWRMHHVLFENQDALEMPDLQEYASELELDPEAFVEDLRRHRFRERIAADVRSGEGSGVRGTPTFFINDVLLEGAWDFESLWSALSGAAGVELGV
jgi:protein-disulfide isomerase